MNRPTNSELIDALDDVLLTTLSLVRDLSEADAGLPTECPGWTVRDQLAHMVGLEQALQGAPEPDVELPPLDHVRTELAEYMERHVQVRRQLPLCAIADELAGLRPRRVAGLRALAATGDPEVPGAFGLQPLSRSLPIRVFDLWCHEQDIRRAVGLPTRDDCAAAEVAFDRAVLGWTRGLPKQFADLSATLVIDVAGDPVRRIEVRLGDGGETVTLAGTRSELVRTFCGRTGGGAELRGDPEVVEHLAPRLAMTP